MNGYIKESNRGGVYNRLYLDSTVRKKKQEIIEKVTSIITDSNQKSRNKIENILLQKQAKSQAKINNMRAKQQLKEINEVKSVPRINKISKELIGLREGILSNPISLYTAKLLNSNRSILKQITTPKQSFLSLVDLDQSLGKEFYNHNSQLYKEESSQLVQHSQNNNKSIQDFAALRNHNANESSTLQDKEIEDLRQAVFNRCKVMEHEEPQADLLKMDVLERSNY